MGCKVIPTHPRVFSTRNRQGNMQGGAYMTLRPMAMPARAGGATTDGGPLQVLRQPIAPQPAQGTSVLCERQIRARTLFAEREASARQRAGQGAGGRIGWDAGSGQPRATLSLYTAIDCHSTLSFLRDLHRNLATIMIAVILFLSKRVPPRASEQQRAVPGGGAGRVGGQRVAEVRGIRPDLAMGSRVIQTLLSLFHK
jgi:hypothetical protein